MSKGVIHRRELKYNLCLYPRGIGVFVSENMIVRKWFIFDDIKKLVGFIIF